MSEKIAIFTGVTELFFDIQNAHAELSEVNADVIITMYNYTKAYNKLLQSKSSSHDARPQVKGLSMFANQIKAGYYFLEDMKNDLEYLKKLKLKTQLSLI